MTKSHENFLNNILEGRVCLENYTRNNEAFALRYVWIVSISSLDLYLTELVSEVGLNLISRSTPILTSNLENVAIPLGRALKLGSFTPTERLLALRGHIYTEVQFRSFYKPDKISEALSFIWTCPGKEKWARIFVRMSATGRYAGRTEQEIREELTFIGDRRDLIAHSADIAPGQAGPNEAVLEDARRVLQFVSDLASAIDAETEAQLATSESSDTSKGA